MRNLFLASLLAAAPVFAQALVRLTVPPCVEPGSTVLVSVQVELEPAQTLKSYDVRLFVDPAQGTILENQIAQGPWLPSGGPVFFWHDMSGDVLVVNAAILGPGLHVTGTGTLFTVPVQLNGATLADIEPTLHDLYDVDAQLLPSLALPAAVQAPCLDFNLRIENLPATEQVRLEWDAQPWTASYVVYSLDLGGAWQPRETTTLTDWTDDAVLPGRLYQVRSVFDVQP